MKKIIALIAARKGSRRLPNKHILEFGDSNLLIRKIRQLKQAKGIDSIMVSTDCEIMLDMAHKEGVEIHKREPEYCDEKSKNYGELVAYLCGLVDSESILWAPCVCPLIGAEYYSRAVEIYKDLVVAQNKWDGVISACEFKQFLWNEHGPLNYGLGKVGHRQSQNLPDWYIIINAFFLAPRKKMIEWQFHYGLNSYRLLIPKSLSIDIDDDVDFKIAQALLR